MPSNRSLLWIVLVGAVLIAGAYYLGMSHAPQPMVPAAAVAPAASNPVATPTPSAAADDPSPMEATAADAARSIDQINQDQQQQMMEKPKLPMDGEWVDAPAETPAPKN